jgi:hypothetical protein
MKGNTLDKTELYNRYNTDDVFNRVVIAGLLNLMNNKIHYDQIFENTVIEDVHVPCMYDFGSSDERFAQDNYTFFGAACFGEKKIDGKFDMLPRCAIRYTGSQIDSNNITNKGIRGTYMKNENGKLSSYSALLYSIPLTFNFECEMWIDNLDTAFKIEQSLREVFYKNRTYNVLFRGTKIGCCVGFPETTNLTKTMQYAFDSERMIKLNFNLVVETYQPVFTEPMPAGTIINYFGVDITYNSLSRDADKDIYIKLDDIPRGTVLPTGLPIMITWQSKSNVSELLTLSLSYIDQITGKEHQIATPLYNEGYYMWTIPQRISNYMQPMITYLPDDSQRIEESPIIRIVPEKDGTIKETSFSVISPGRIISDSSTMHILLEYTNSKNGNVEMCDTTYMINIDKGGVNMQNPVSIVNGMPYMKYKNNFEKLPISLKLTYPLDRTFYDQIDGLYIL